jgi:hypothetical protein
MWLLACSSKLVQRKGKQEDRKYVRVSGTFILKFIIILREQSGNFLFNSSYWIMGTKKNMDRISFRAEE